MHKKPIWFFFTENGERFYLILNGIRQNENPETNVKVTGLPHPQYKVKFLFEDPKLGEFDKNAFCEAGKETVYVVKKNKKDKWVMRMMSVVAIDMAPKPREDQQVITFNTQPMPAPSTSVTVTESTTTTTISDGANTPTGEGVSMGISVNEGGMGFNMNVNVNDGMGTTTESTTTSYTTTTTTSTSFEEKPASQPALPGYSGPTGCDWPISDGDFNSAKGSIQSKTFEDSKLTIAKQVIGANCMLSDQVRQVMLLFDFEDTRLELAKYAYRYTYDQGNYYKVNDAFDFELSIDELNEYIKGQ